MANSVLRQLIHRLGAAVIFVSFIDSAALGAEDSVLNLSKSSASKSVLAATKISTKHSSQAESGTSTGKPPQGARSTSTSATKHSTQSTASTSSKPSLTASTTSAKRSAQTSTKASTKQVPEIADAQDYSDDSDSKFPNDFLKNRQDSGKNDTTKAPPKVERKITAVGVVKVEEDNVIHVNTPFSGRLAKQLVQLDDRVQSGETLAVIESGEVAKLLADFFHKLHDKKSQINEAAAKANLAQSDVERFQKLFNEGIAAKKDLLLAQETLSVARQNLTDLQEDRKHIQQEAELMAKINNMSLPDPDSSDFSISTLAIKSPGPGVLTKRFNTTGDTVAAGQILYEIARVTQVWVEFSLPDRLVGRVRRGQKVSFVTDDYPGKVRLGTVWTVKDGESPGSFIVRAEFENEDRMLRPQMVGRAMLEN